MKTHDYELWLERLWKGERRAAARLISQVENSWGRIDIMCQILPR
ncbi:MAG TPA: methylmalonyl Co-A mutase-associated GTPase MeaB, partial [Desulfitobacterium dehalogenans]|nr:methylmalonyl Co-A mutase-associated GTPase MeaB [Desulfitobacterium dehalogenans]